MAVLLSDSSLARQARLIDRLAQVLGVAEERVDLKRASLHLKYRVLVQGLLALLAQEPNQP